MDGIGKDDAFETREMRNRGKVYAVSEQHERVSAQPPKTFERRLDGT